MIKWGFIYQIYLRGAPRSVRIIDKRRDYYDGVASQGVDPSIIYVRKEKETPFRLDQFCMPHLGYFDKYVIGFCGQIRPLVKISGANRLLFESLKSRTNEDLFFYNIDEVDRYASQWIERRAKWYDCPFQMNESRKNFLKFFQNTWAKLETIFTDHKTPIFLLDCSIKSKLFLNPLLRPFEFQRIVDPYTAFQELSMYIGGILGNLNPKVPDVSNEDLIVAKGFDKWSFRKESTKSRPRAKRA
jgi:hypothetical protein